MSALRTKIFKQVNLLSGVIERNRNKKPKLKLVTEADYKQEVAKKSKLKHFIENQLALPILDFDGSPVKREKLLPLLPDDFLIKGFPDIVTKHRAFRASDSFDKDEDLDQLRRKIYKMAWDDNALVTAHADLLVISLSELATEGNPKEKADVLAWIFSGEEVMWHGRREIAIKAPFSFMACCSLSGYDPITLQEIILSKLPESSKTAIARYQAAA